MRAAGHFRAVSFATLFWIGAAGIHSTLLAQFIDANSSAISRHGIWFSGGLGYGSASGPNTARMGSMSGGVAAGWTLNPKLQVGLGATGWAKTVPGDGETNFNIGVGTVDARVRFYPDPAFRFFLTGGFGLGVIRFYDRGKSFYHTGRGILFGAGYDIAISPTVSLSPFANYYDVHADDARMGVGQVGLALTVY